MLPKLNILISTYDKGIQQLGSVIIKPIPGVYYTVIHQYSDEQFKKTPEFLKRDDINVTHLPGRGVTKSRNKAIDLAEGEIGLFADDDVRYNPIYFEKLKKIFSENEMLDIGLFRIKTPPTDPEYTHYRADRHIVKKSSICRNNRNSFSYSVCKE